MTGWTSSGLLVINVIGLTIIVAAVNWFRSSPIGMRRLWLALAIATTAVAMLIAQVSVLLPVLAN